MEGLPPLPKSLSGLLSFSRTSLSRAEASLGLRSNSVPSASTATTRPLATSSTPTTAAAPNRQINNPSRNSTGSTLASTSSGYVSSASVTKNSIAKEQPPVAAPAAAPPAAAGINRPPMASGFQQYSKATPRPLQQLPHISPSPSPFRPIQSPGPQTYQNAESPVRPLVAINNGRGSTGGVQQMQPRAGSGGGLYNAKLEHSSSTASSRSSISSPASSVTPTQDGGASSGQSSQRHLASATASTASVSPRGSLESPTAVQAAMATVAASKRPRSVNTMLAVDEKVDPNWMRTKLPQSLLMSMSMLKTGSIQMTTPEPPIIGVVGVTSLQAHPSRSSLLNGGNIDTKLAILRKEMVI
jgi:hypothetical protein